MDDKVNAPPLRAPLANSSSPRDKEPKEVDKLLKWQEERMARKLRGEYESAILHLSDVINGNLDTPVNISAVRVEGATHTRKSFLASIINPALPPPPSPTFASASPSAHPNTLKDVLHTTRRISHALKKTDIFTSVDVQLERARDPLAGAGDVDLVFRTRERGRLYASSATELGNNEGSASASARIRNLFGGAETFEANLSLGTKTRRAFRAALSSPLTPSLATFGEISAYGMEKDLSTYASCFEGLRGVKALVRNGTLETGAHEVAYEAVVRHISGLTPTASISMREQAGPSLKSSLTHSYTYDTRDDRIAATRGVYAKLVHELAGASLGLGGLGMGGLGMGGLGMGGDASFYRVEGEGQVSRRLGGTGSISLAARSGILYPLGGKKTLFSDRFQLGGPTSVRSFRANSMGPRDGSDSVGGELYYSAGASVISNIPSKAHWPVKTHVWVNAGRLDSINKEIPLSHTILATLSRPSLSAGIGLIYRFDPVRVEVNFGVPLVAAGGRGEKGEGRRGVQVGMGLEFM
ncbi:surface antigen-domain-containing protein [Crassisporium funariophilum]|nr:surface antigen-domain-containing protein [Crassisporium funariophilum]